MRNIIKLAVSAFYKRENFSQSNTTVKVEADKVTMFLHGNPIAIQYDDCLVISTCGWNSNTTKERLNGLNGVNVTTKNFVQYLNGIVWNGDTIAID